MSLAHPDYESLSPQAKAAWHNASGDAVMAAAHRRFTITKGSEILEQGRYNAEKHYRTARRILWAASLKGDGRVSG